MILVFPCTQIRNQIVLLHKYQHQNIYQLFVLKKKPVLIKFIPVTTEMILMNKTCFFNGILFICMVLLYPLHAYPQEVVINKAVHSDVSIPLRDMKPLRDFFWEKWMTKVEHEIPNKFRKSSSAPVVDKALQTNYSPGYKTAAAFPILNFDGLSNQDNTDGRVTPPDPAGDVGPNHYVQAVNCMLQVFDKAGNSVYGPVKTATLWSGFSGNWNDHNDGDAIILYDENADRWIISQFAIDCPGSPKTEYQLVAVSATPDPTGPYNRYAFQFDYLPDYGKLGVWNDGYYLSVNRYNTNTATNPFIGAGACVLERSKMLSGDSAARMILFKTELLGDSGSAAGTNCYSMLPSDCDGPFPAEGSPNYFTYIDPSAELRIWALHADWITPENASFTYITALQVAAYNELGTVAQPAHGIALDGLGDRLMFRNQYRNFGSYETFVTCHNVDVGNDIAGLRWYEYRKVGSLFSLHQQSTFAPPDGNSRWMGSIAMNASGDIGIAYSVTGNSLFPSICYTGRKAADPLNQFTKPEGIIQSGTAYMTGLFGRWGDYTAMSIDPVDNQTFWTTQEYVGAFGGSYPWATRIASFQFPDMPVATTLPATEITATSAKLNATVNPYGLATEYYFEWGTTSSYGNSTSLVSAGSGTAELEVSEVISALFSDTTYHFRIVAINNDGTSFGNDLTFIPGVPIVLTTAVSAITTSSVICGGDIISDGGIPVLSRGICWATTSNPVVEGNHTAEGSGTGSFISLIDGLVSNTLYHARAYAQNANGFYYGQDVEFTTLCETVSSFPWNEGFENAGAMPNCWSQEQIEGSVLNWSFMAGSGTAHPAAAHQGKYNANLNDFTSDDTRTRLVTPVLNLELLPIPVLTFWHTQAAWSEEQDQLTVYYKTGEDSLWKPLQSYTSSIDTWTIETVILPEKSNVYQVAFEGNAKWGYGICIDDVTVAGTNISLWDGSVDSDWNTPGNWTDNTIPFSANHVIIPSDGITHFPVITLPDLQCANLTILKGANIRINSEGTLSVPGALVNSGGYEGLVIQSDSSGSGSLVHNSDNVAVTFEKYISGSNDSTIHKFHFVSIPVVTENASAGDLFPGAGIHDFDESTNEWIPYSSGIASAINEKKGYRVFTSGNITFPISGLMNNDTFSPLLSWTKLPGAERGWNLVPNPYPSYIDWDLVSIRHYVDKAIYIWPEAGPAGSSNYYQYVGGISIPKNAMNGQIAPGHSFFIHANAVFHTVSFTNACRIAGKEPILNADTVPNVLYLEASTPAGSDYTAVRFTWQATPEFDTELDAYKLTGGEDAPKLNSLTTDGTELSINSLPFSPENVWVPLHFGLNTDATVSLKATGLESFGSDIPIYLEDRLLKQGINLRQQSEYTFDHKTTYEPARFWLRFTGPYSIEENGSQTQGKVFLAGDEIYLEIPSMEHMPVQITITDALGRRYRSYKLEMNGTVQLPAPGSAGVYIIRVTGKNTIFTGKVVVR